MEHCRAAGKKQNVSTQHMHTTHAHNTCTQHMHTTHARNTIMITTVPSHRTCILSKHAVLPNQLSEHCSYLAFLIASCVMTLWPENYFTLNCPFRMAEFKEQVAQTFPLQQRMNEASQSSQVLEQQLEGILLWLLDTSQHTLNTAKRMNCPAAACKKVKYYCCSV